MVVLNRRAGQQTPPRTHAQAGQHCQRKPLLHSGSCCQVLELCEAKTKLFLKLVLPLLHQRTRSDDEAAPQVAAEHQLLCVKSRHDRLASAWVIGEKEAKRLAQQHHAVNSCDLVRQRLDCRQSQRKIGIIQVC